MTLARRAKGGLDRIVVHGAPFARGQQYGQLARQKIRHAIERYREVFRHRAGLEWHTALAHARTFERGIGEFSPASLQEMRGIAEGAGVEVDAILALNCRSELMFAAADAAGRNPPSECTAFAVLPEASENGHTLVGQNWDWVPFAGQVCVLLEVHRDDGPGYLTVVEAGMLAKVGFNSAGLGVCTNTLVTPLERTPRGVPYHVMLRALLDAETMTEAARMLFGTERALAANYLIAHRSGVAANFETIAGDGRNVRVTMPDRGVIAHANHFLAPEFADLDLYVTKHPHSLFRLDGMRRGLARALPRVSVDGLREILRSHENAPDGICSHPDGKAHPLEARVTVASVIADLALGEVWMTAGPPCRSEYERYELRGLFDGARGSRSMASA
ncbi:MAG TPA: C45 family peptidase [Burkholderiales bacterium]|nr:C45 family peptidase [Burkholderiales bacterium]